MNTSKISLFAARHLNLIQSSRVEFSLLSTGLEKLAEPDFRMIMSTAEVGTSGPDYIRHFEAARRLLRRKLLASALRRLRVANGAFLKNAGVLAGSPTTKVLQVPTVKRTGAPSARPSELYMALVPLLKLEPRHSHALASLEALELFLSPRKPKSASAPEPPPKSFLYHLESVPNLSGRVGLQTKAVALDLESVGDVDRSLFAPIFDTAQVCASHVAARLTSIGKL